MKCQCCENRVFVDGLTSDGHIALMVRRGPGTNLRFLELMNEGEGILTGVSLTKEQARELIGTLNCQIRQIEEAETGRMIRRIIDTLG